METPTIAEIDEAIGHLSNALKIDEYGNRMNWKKRQFLQNAIDDLLDERLNLTEGKNEHKNSSNLISDS